MQRMLCLIALLSSFIICAGCAGDAAAVLPCKPTQRVADPLHLSIIMYIKGPLGDDSGMLQIHVKGVRGDKDGYWVEGDAQIAADKHPQVCERVIIDNFYLEKADGSWSDEPVAIAEIDPRSIVTSDPGTSEPTPDTDGDGTLSDDELNVATPTQLDEWRFEHQPAQ